MPTQNAEASANTNAKPKVKIRGTLPPWPKVPKGTKVAKHDPLRFISEEPAAKRAVGHYLTLAVLYTALGFGLGLNFAAWLQTPQPWALVSRFMAWWAR